jgi:hypothetical protein
MTERDRAPSLRIQIEGGLGNQLFQYAAAYCAAMRLGCSLTVEMAGATAIAFRGTSRDFAIEWLTRPDAVVRRSWHRGLARRVLRAFPRTASRGLFIESGFAYDSRILTIRPGTTLVGYFQSWRYFAGFEELLRNEIRSAAPRSPWFQETAGSLDASGDWTAVHVRRGDYALARNSAFHGLLGPAYYRSAVEQIRRHIPSGPLVLFSDEPTSALSALSEVSDEVIIVTPEQEAHPMESIMLMSRASAVITANSSFSWWGAWLAGPNVPVACPATWFRGARYDEADLRPPSWITAASDFEGSPG